MKKLEAIYNAGRWMVYCPIHGKDGAVLAMDYHATDRTQSKLWTVNNEYICPVCHPAIAVELSSIEKGQIVKRIDRQAQATARLVARSKGEIYEVVFPSEKEEIENALKDRPQLWKNWDGKHESVKFLKEENEFLRKG